MLCLGIRECLHARAVPDPGRLTNFGLKQSEPEIFSRHTSKLVIPERLDAQERIILERSLLHILRRGAVRQFLARKRDDRLTTRIALVAHRVESVRHLDLERIGQSSKVALERQAK